MQQMQQKQASVVYSRNNPALSGGVLGEIRKLIVPGMSNNITDAELHGLAAYLWDWRMEELKKRRFVVATTDDHLCQLSPILEDPEKNAETFFLWFVRQLSQGRCLVMVGRGFIDPIIFDWMNLFTPKPMVAIS